MMYAHSSPEETENDDGADEFNALEPRLRKRIDRAFDRAIQQAGGSSRKNGNGDAPEKSPTNTEASARPKSPKDTKGGTPAPDDSDLGGGFMPMEEDADDSAGGFIVDEPETPAKPSRSGSDSTPSHIPLSVVPSALQILDLPQDMDVLSIFENAASGWSGRRVGEEDGVSRKDWRAVCAILFADPKDTGMRDTSDDEAMPFERDEEDEEPGDEVDQDDEDVYEESEDEDADSNYGPKAGSSKKPTRRIRSRGKQRARSSSASTSPSGRYTLTPRQQKECRTAYALFFPDSPDKELPKRRVLIKDVAAAARLINEKLTMEDIVEMLEYFSTSADKSMSLSDFEQMMMQTGQV